MNRKELARAFHDYRNNLWKIEILQKFTYMNTNDPQMVVINGFNSMAGIENLVTNGYKSHE